MREGFSCLSFVPVKCQNENSTLNSPESLRYNKKYASDTEEPVEMDFISLAKASLLLQATLLEAVPACLQMKLGRGNGEDSQNPSGPSEGHNKHCIIKLVLV